MAYATRKIKKEITIEKYVNCTVSNSSKRTVAIRRFKILPGESVVVDLTQKQIDSLRKVLNVTETQDDAKFKGIDYFSPKVSSVVVDTHDTGFAIPSDTTTAFVKPVSLYIQDTGVITVLDENFQVRTFKINQKNVTLPIKVIKVFYNNTSVKQIVAFGSPAPLGSKPVAGNTDDPELDVVSTYLLDDTGAYIVDSTGVYFVVGQ
jgi:hypothetical protein